MVLDLTRKYGRLTPICFDKKIGVKKYYLFRCDCGNEKSIHYAAVKRGATKSCGCLKKEPRPGIGPKPRLDQAGIKRLLRLQVELNYQSRARHIKKPFLLTTDEFNTLIENDCFYCGKEPSNLTKYKQHQLPYNGIDRIDNEKGYELGNVVTCCKVCNLMKKAMTQHEFLSHIKNIYERHN